MDLPLSDELYLRYRDLLLARAGLYYPERRRGDLAHALSQTAVACGYKDLMALFAALVGGGPCWEQAIAQLTIGETYFMRNGAQFAALRERILPDLVERRRGVRSLRIWSAGCATGEEPYSLAMILADALPAVEDWQVSILATDINPQFLERAREALYGPWSFRETPEELRTRFFTPEGSRWRLRPELRRLVLFARLNLAEPSYPAVTNGTVALDMIFCRNVTIYFDEATTRQVVARFYAALSPGGWLVVGHAEPNSDTYSAFEIHNVPGAVLYRKPLSAPAFVSVSASGPPIALPPPHLVPLAAPRPASAPLSRRPERGGALAAPSTAADALEAARVAANRGDWPAALAAAEAARVTDGLRAEVHYLLGQIYEHLGQLDTALAAYRRSVYLEPGWVLGVLGMAGIWRQTGDLAEARRGYRGALRLLARLAPDECVPGADGTSAADLLGYAELQLTLLG